MSILAFERVSKFFGEFQAVKEVTLEVNRGEILALLGPSGCGKTTTLRMIAGLERCDSGEIIFNGEVIDSAEKNKFVPAEKRNLGMVFQSYAIWPNMSVFENIAFPLRVRGLAEAEIKSRVRRIVELVGLQDLEERRSTDLSGGQQQRVAVGRCLVFDPEIILLDEPFSNLDAKLREQMRLEMKLLQKRVGATIVLVTHDQTEALSLADRIAVMHRGGIEQVGTPEELYLHPATPFVRDFLGQTVKLAAQVAGIGNDGSIEVTFPNMTSVRYRVRHHFLPSPKQGDTCVLVARPDDIRMDSLDARGVAGESELEINGKIDTVLFMGDHYDALVSLANGEQFVGLLSKHGAWRVGQALRIVLPTHITVWPR
ncbi:MAG: ABC transporter ATP-binding protein [Burkholderiales bacterium]